MAHNIKPGVATGREVQDIFKLAKEKGFAVPAVNVIGSNSINGVLITAISERNDFDFESRYFWPWSGTNEDPVTGATHTFLAKYWHLH